VRALEIAGAQRRDDWYWTMSAVLLSRQEQRPIFDRRSRSSGATQAHER